MGENQFNRLEIILKDKLEVLQDNCVAIIGCGGVGSYAIEALARSGIKKLVIVDKDVIDITNLNRQLMALHSNIGQSKVDVLKSRILDINPNANVVALKMLYDEESAHKVYKEKPDFVIDACDTISAKLHIIKYCYEKRIPFVSSMGAANKWNASNVEVVDISKTYNDPIAKVIRTTLKKKGITKKVPVVFSDEIPFKPEIDNKEYSNTRKELPLLGSTAFVPSTFGLVAANYCCDILLKKEK
ncbi:MAG: tRNA threonylcarbamoyladenosine dehydratase [Erysipelotrichales bacterium]